MCNRADVDEKSKEFRYPEGIYLSALRILRDDLLSIRHLFIAAAKLIFAVGTTCTTREYLGMHRVTHYFVRACIFLPNY